MLNETGEDISLRESSLIFAQTNHTRGYAASRRDFLPIGMDSAGEAAADAPTQDPVALFHLYVAEQVGRAFVTQSLSASGAPLLPLLPDRSKPQCKKRRLLSSDRSELWRRSLLRFVLPRSMR